jgi:hypothetical protein
MQGSSQHEPDWQHWPGRSAGDERLRNRLRSLFVPTDAGDAIAELIAEHSRELESRAEELRTAVADLEQREARARELHAKIEQVLREGSAELDVRHSDLVVRTTELDRREAALAEAEARVEDRARALGAVELKGAALERREEALALREQAISARERALERDTSTPDTSTDSPGGTAPEESTHVALFLDNGYRVAEGQGAAPATGEVVTVDGVQYRCARITPSPYPNDRRRCAVLERLAPADAGYPSQASSSAPP